MLKTKPKNFLLSVWFPKEVSVSHHKGRHTATHVKPKKLKGRSDSLTSSRAACGAPFCLSHCFLWSIVSSSAHLLPGRREQGQLPGSGWMVDLARLESYPPTASQSLQVVPLMTQVPEALGPFLFSPPRKATCLVLFQRL